MYREWVILTADIPGLVLGNQMSIATPTAVARMSTMPGSIILRSDAVAIKSTIQPLISVFEAAAKTMARDAVAGARPVPCELSSDMDTVIASTSTRPDTTPETYAPAS